jgi:hypothetical protein
MWRHIPHMSLSDVCYRQALATSLGRLVRPVRFLQRPPQIFSPGPRAEWSRLAKEIRDVAHDPNKDFWKPIRYGDPRTKAPA